MGKKPIDRVKRLLGRLHSITISKNRGSKISKEAGLLFNKFVKQVDKIFKNLPKSLEWRSFCLHDLPLLIDFCEEVRRTEVGDRRSEGYGSCSKASQFGNRAFSQGFLPILVSRMQRNRTLGVLRRSLLIGRKR